MYATYYNINSINYNHAIFNYNNKKLKLILIDLRFIIKIYIKLINHWLKWYKYCA